MSNSLSPFWKTLQCPCDHTSGGWLRRLLLERPLSRYLVTWEPRCVMEGRCCSVKFTLTILEASSVHKPRRFRKCEFEVRGDAYGSDVLSGFQSRPLRESEFHARAARSGHSLKCDITWVAAPAIGEDGTADTIESFPVLLPSSLALRLHRNCFGMGFSYQLCFYVWILKFGTQQEARALLGQGFVSTMIPDSPDELHDYWQKMLLDFPGHHLCSKPAQWRWTIPVAIWGDEGSLNRRSWMLTSWKLGSRWIYFVIVDGSFIRFEGQFLYLCLLV